MSPGDLGDLRDLVERAELHAALGDPVRLGIVDELAASDRTSSELAKRCGLASNLVAHHLAALERVGLITRVASTGDRRRRYVRLRPERLGGLGIVTVPPADRVLFVCTRNSARSPLAAALWRARTGLEAASAGTHPAERVHPAAVAAGARAGLDLGDATPRRLGPGDLDGATVVTVCDRAHEELPDADAWLHWSISDPAEVGTPAAFDSAVAQLGVRMATLAPAVPDPHHP